MAGKSNSELKAGCFQSKKRSEVANILMDGILVGHKVRDSIGFL